MHQQTGATAWSRPHFLEWFKMRRRGEKHCRRLCLPNSAHFGIPRLILHLFTTGNIPSLVLSPWHQRATNGSFFFPGFTGQCPWSWRWREIEAWSSGGCTGAVHILPEASEVRQRLSEHLMTAHRKQWPFNYANIVEPRYRPGGAGRW